MKEIQHNKFSLFRLEKYYTLSDDIIINCFEYIDTFESLKEAQEVQNKEELKTLIVSSW